MNRHNIVTPIIKSLMIITIGCFIFAMGFNIFIFPLSILTGGVTGVSIILYEWFQFSPALSQWALNIPLFFWGWMAIGNEYAIKIVYGSFFLPYAVKITENLSNYIGTFNYQLSVVLGSALMGLGLGFILNTKGSTGGLDIPARILSEHFKIGIGLAIALIDTIVICAGMIVFQILNGDGLKQGFYALIVLVIMTSMIDLITINTPGHNTLRSVLQRLRIIKYK